MVYIYKKKIGGREYYYLRASLKKNGKIITKDIKYLGNNVNAIKNNLKSIPSKYSEEIRKTYKTIHRFLEVNTYLEKIRKIKIKSNDYLNKESLENIEACKAHWNEKFHKLDRLTKEETLKNIIIEFAFNTTSNEGNTITLKQAQSLLIDNLTPKNKTLIEIYDLQNTEKVFMNLFNNTDKKISHETIRETHDELLENIDARKGYRTTDVRVFKANFKSTPAPYVKTDMNLLLKWYCENKGMLHPFILATIFHHKFEKIHPFMDGNGRTGRMLLNYILLKNNHPPIIIRKKNRLAYLEKLHKADECPLTKATPQGYKPLTEFSAKEMTENYWNLFL